MSKKPPTLSSNQRAGESQVEVVTPALPERQDSTTARWPSALPRPGHFENFGETPLGFYNPSRASTDIWMSNTDSPIIGTSWFQRTASQTKDDISTRNTSNEEVTTESTPTTDKIVFEVKVPQTLINAGPTVTGSPIITTFPEVVPVVYDLPFPVPPPPPSNHVTASGASLCTPKELKSAWLQWHALAELWWKANQNYPPPPQNPDYMEDKPYQGAEWYVRTERWWTHMNTTYFLPMALMTGCTSMRRNNQILQERGWGQSLSRQASSVVSN
eukprot:PhF_6_TR29187/c0_g1_i2/m.42703